MAALRPHREGAAVARSDAPGRVNLIGEHTDYNEGFVLPTAIPQRTSVDLEPRTDDRVALASEGFPRVSYRLGSERRSGDWADYVRGVTWALADAGVEVGGFDVHVRSDVPAGAGLSSSAALEVGVLRALRAAFSLELDDVALALLAHRAEVDFVGARVGTMDQLATSLAHDGEALLIDTRTLEIERVPLPADLALVIVDSGITHEHASGGYNTRREECERAARVLGVAALRDATADGVVSLADPILARRARHVVSENARVLAFVGALRAHDLATCGAILDSSHESLRDDFEVSTPELDALAAFVRAEEGVYGARMVGGGFGGSVLAIARPDAARRVADRGAAAYAAATGRSARVLLPV
jgi:galactokinase